MEEEKIIHDCVICTEQIKKGQHKFICQECKTIIHKKCNKSGQCAMCRNIHNQKKYDLYQKQLIDHYDQQNQQEYEAYQVQPQDIQSPEINEPIDIDTFIFALRLTYQGITEVQCLQLYREYFDNYLDELILQKQQEYLSDHSEYIPEEN